jgi:hypothetical protein
MSSFPFEQKPIRLIEWANANCCHAVGTSGVELIEVQYVPGEGAMIPWFICWGKDGKLIAAVNSSKVECVTYV